MNKPAFDPNQPFESSKPAFDPNQPFESAAADQEQPSAMGLAVNAAANLGRAINPVNIAKGLGEQVYEGAYALPRDIAKSTVQMAQGTPYAETPVAQRATDISNAPQVQDPGKYAYENPVDAAMTVAAPVLPFLKSPLMPEGESNFANALGRKAARVGEALSGVNERDIRQLFNKPGTLFTPGSQAEAGKAIGEVKINAGVNPGVTEDISTMTRENVVKALDVKQTGERALHSVVAGSDSPEEIGDALKYVSDEIKGRLAQQKDASELIHIQNHLNTILEGVAPEVQAARQEFAPIAQRNKFLKLFPANKNGTISKANLFYLNTIAKGITAPFRAPITTGLATSLAGGVSQLPFRNAVMTEFISRITTKGPQDGQ